MSRLPLLTLLAVVAVTGCDKKSGSSPAPAPGSAATTPVAAAGSAKATSPAKPADPKPADPKPADPKPVAGVVPGPATDHVIQTGALDFELVERGQTFILRDDAYEMTFGHQPKVTEDKQSAPNGIKLKTLTAMASFGQTDAYGVFLLPIPKNVPYDVKNGMKQARDGAFNGMGVKMTSEVDTTLGGLPGKKAVGAGVVQGISFKVELRMVFDKSHHTMIGMMALTAAAEFPAAAQTFLSSLQVKPGEGPPAGDGT